ncbi:MAG: hypothetical protein HYY93_13615 [Planctomycetes bacterium]|nr:hypothetical protein [Planctomycetota bacterium]
MTLWVERTPDEVAGWNRYAGREARWQGCLTAAAILVILPLLFAGGWLVNLRASATAPIQGPGSFARRLAVALAIAVPVACVAYRFERQKELSKLSRSTVCPKCEASGKGNDGSVCSCGGSFVSLSRVKWVEGGS